MNGRKGFPADAAFEPRDSLALFIAVQTVLKRETTNASLSQLRKDLESVNPELFFSGERDISRGRAREYEFLLKETLRRWTLAGHADLVQKVF